MYVFIDYHTPHFYHQTLPRDFTIATLYNVAITASCYVLRMSTRVFEYVYTNLLERELCMWSHRPPVTTHDYPCTHGVLHTCILMHIQCTCMRVHSQFCLAVHTCTMVRLYASGLLCPPGSGVWLWSCDVRRLLHVHCLPAGATHLAEGWLQSTAGGGRLVASCKESGPVAHKYDCQQYLPRAYGGHVWHTRSKPIPSRCVHWSLPFAGHESCRDPGILDGYVTECLKVYPCTQFLCLSPAGSLVP